MQNESRSGPSPEELGLRVDVSRPHDARFFVESFLDEQPAEVVYEVQLIVSELVTNALEHGREHGRETPPDQPAAMEKSSYEVTLWLGFSEEPPGKWFVVVAVHDSNPATPDLDRDPDRDLWAEGGRGLAIVQKLGSLSYKMSPTGKRVVVKYPLEHPPRLDDR